MCGEKGGSLRSGNPWGGTQRNNERNYAIGSHPRGSKDRFNGKLKRWKENGIRGALMNVSRDCEYIVNLQADRTWRVLQRKRCCWTSSELSSWVQLHKKAQEAQPGKVGRRENIWEQPIEVLEAPIPHLVLEAPAPHEVLEVPVPHPLVCLDVKWHPPQGNGENEPPRVNPSSTQTHQ